jgi:CRP-like cAMP-binding protein
MQRASNAKTGNRLLDALPPKSLRCLQTDLESIALVLGAPVHATKHVYFPVSGMISVVATVTDRTPVEIGMIGREGMYRVSAILSDHKPFPTAMVQLAGRALRLRARLLRREMQVDVRVQQLLQRYAQAILYYVTQSAACNRVHMLEQRFARWLLECHDRADADTFPVTHKFLAMNLGVRRPSVTLVAQSLQQNGLITYYHGTMTVLDREGLEAVSCNCYRVIQNEFACLFGRSLIALGTSLMFSAHNMI